MDPNQQPPQNPNQNGYTPEPTQAPAQTPVQPYFGAAPVQPNQPTQPSSWNQQQPQPQPTTPQPGYGPAVAPSYAVDYLDQIAPPPAKPKFFSGLFGKLFVVMMVVLLFAVGIIVASGNQKKTADLEAIALRLDNMQTVTKDTNKNLKNGKLLATNSNYQIWIANADHDAYALLTEAGVKKSQMDKKVSATEKANATKLTAKFLDAKLNAELDRVYAQQMAYQTQLMISALNKMSKTSQAKAIRDYAKNASTNLVPIQKSFADFDDSTATDG